MNNNVYNMYEINQELEELIKKLVKRIRRIKNKNPERIENIMRGVNLVMSEDVEYIAKFFEECELSMLPKQSNPQINWNSGTISAPTTPVPNSWNITPCAAYPSKEELNIRYGMESMMQSEIQAQAAAAEFTRNVIRELGPGHIPPERQMAIMGDVKEFLTHGKFFEAREVIKGNWISHTEPAETITPKPEFIHNECIISDTVKDVMHAIVQSDEKSEPVEETKVLPDEEVKLPTVTKKRKFVSDTEVDLISRVIRDNPEMKSSEMIKLLNMQGILINPSVFSNIRNKVSSTRISDKYFTLGTDADGKRIIIPIPSTPPHEKQHTAEEKLNQKIQKKLAQHQLLDDMELEYIVKVTSNEIKSCTMEDIFNALKKKQVNISFNKIRCILEGDLNQLPNVPVYSPTSEHSDESSKGELNDEKEGESE